MIKKNKNYLQQLSCNTQQAAPGLQHELESLLTVLAFTFDFVALVAPTDKASINGIANITKVFIIEMLKFD